MEETVTGSAMDPNTRPRQDIPANLPECSCTPAFGTITEGNLMTKGMEPDTMAPAQRLDEVGMLLSLAMMRLWLKRRGGNPGPAPGQRGFSRGSVDNRLEVPLETPLSVSVDSKKE